MNILRMDLVGVALLSISALMLSACSGGSGGGGSGSNTSGESASPFTLSFGDGMDQDIRDVTIDSANNIIIVGINDGDIDLGAGTVTSTDDDLFIAKYDSSGNHLWSRVIIGVGIDTAGDVAVDSNDDIFFTGNFSNQINFGSSGDELNSIGSQDLFIAKVSGTDGSHIWSMNAGGTGAAAFGSDIAISPVDDSVVVAGVFYGDDIDLGGGALSIVGGSQVFLGRFLNLNAEHQFSAAFGNSADQSVAGLAVDSLGNIILAGYFSGSIDLGGGILMPNGGGFNDGFLARFDSSGNHLASNAYGGTGSDVATGLAIDSNDVIVLSGLFYDSIDLGGGPLTSPVPNSLNFYLARFNSALTHLFSQRYVETGIPTDFKVSIDPTNDNMIVAGNLTGTVNFGGTLINSGSGQDVVFSSFTSGGTHINSAGYGDNSDQQVRDIAASAVPRYLLAGRFDGVIDFGSGAISSLDEDAFLTSLAPY